MEIRVSLHYALKWFFTYSEKLIGSLLKNGQGKYMSKIQKCDPKFIHCFLCGPEKVGTNGGKLWKVGTNGWILGEVWEFIYPQIWYINNIIISAQTVLLPMS